MVTVEEYDPNNEFLASKFSYNCTIKDTMRVHKDIPGGKWNLIFTRKAMCSCSDYFDGGFNSCTKHLDWLKRSLIKSEKKVIAMWKSQRVTENIFFEAGDFVADFYRADSLVNIGQIKIVHHGGTLIPILKYNRKLSLCSTFQWPKNRWS